MAAGDTCAEAIEYDDLGAHARPSAPAGLWYKLTAPRSGDYTVAISCDSFDYITFNAAYENTACEDIELVEVGFGFFYQSFLRTLSRGGFIYFRVEVAEAHTITITGPAAPDVTDVDRTAVNQKQGGGTDYPFAAENFLSGRVLDLYLSYADPACAYVLPFSLTVAGDVYTVTDANDAVVASGDTADAASTPWGDRTVYEWVGDSTVLRVVVREDKLENGSGELDPRTVNLMPGRVESLAVSTDLSGGRRKTGNVALTNGYNTDLTLTLPALTDGGRYYRQVRLDVVPAGGLGRAPGCEELAPLVRSVNNVRPAPGGNVILTADECFRVQLKATRVAVGQAVYLSDDDRHAMTIASDCAPCCSCDYYVRTYAGLRRMVGRWQELTDNAAAVRDIYHRNRERWLAQRACRMDRPLTVNALPLKACYLSVSATFCNMAGVCLLPDAELRLTITSTGVPAEFCHPAYVNGSHTNGDERYTPGTDLSGDGDPVFVAVFPYIDPQDQAHFRLRLRAVGCTEGMPVKVTATMHVPDVEGAELPDPLDDGSFWGSELPTRAKQEIWVAAVAAPPGFCCEE